MSRMSPCFPLCTILTPDLERSLERRTFRRVDACQLAEMAPKPGVSLFGYALCMVTTGVFDVKSNIPPEWRPNLRQPFTAYAISSFFYTAVGTPSVEHVGGSGQPRPPIRPASARLSSGRPPASAASAQWAAWAATPQRSSLGLGLTRGQRAPPRTSRYPRLDRRSRRRRVAGVLTLLQIYLCPPAGPPGWPDGYATAEAI